MTTPTVREVVQASESGGPATSTTSDAVQAGDVLVCFDVSNYDTLANMGAPTGTGSGTWNLETSADLGENVPHMKVWTRTVTTGGVQTTTVTPSVGEEVYQFVYVLSGVDAVDGAAGATSGSGTTIACPSVSPTGADDLLLVGYYCDQAAVEFTQPAGMTDALEEEDAGFGTLGTAREILSASGPTGTRTASSDHDRTGFVGCTVAIKGAAGGPTAVPVGQGTETGTASTLTGTKHLALGQVQVTDAATAITPVKSRPVHMATASETTTGVGRHRSRTAGRAAETSTGQAVIPARTGLVGLVVEADTATMMGRSRVTAVGAVTETTAARATTRAKTATQGRAEVAVTAAPMGVARAFLVTLTGEDDTAELLAGAKAGAVGQPFEDDTAAAYGAGRDLSLGQPAETTTAGQVALAKTQTLGQPAEADTAVLLGRAKQGTLGQPVEVDAAGEVASKVAGTLGQATTTDVARGVTGERRLPFGAVVEDATAGLLRVALGRLLGQVVEADTTAPTVGAKAGALGRVVGVDAAAPVGRSTVYGLGVAGEVNTPAGAVPAKTRSVGRVVEVDAGLLLGGAARRVEFAQAVVGETALLLGARVAGELGQAMEDSTAHRAGVGKGRLLAVAVEASRVGRVFRKPTVGAGFGGGVSLVGFGGSASEEV